MNTLHQLKVQKTFFCDSEWKYAAFSKALKIVSHSFFQSPQIFQCKLTPPTLTEEFKLCNSCYIIHAVISYVISYMCTCKHIYIILSNTFPLLKILNAACLIVSIKWLHKSTLVITFFITPLLKKHSIKNNQKLRFCSPHFSHPKFNIFTTKNITFVPVLPNSRTI